MDSDRWFWVIMGLYAATIVMMISVIISFSFGVGDQPYDETTRLNILLQYGRVRCEDIDYYGVKYTLASGESFQCGYQLSTIMVSYLVLFLLGASEILSLIFATQESGKLALISLIIAFIVPIGLIFSVALQCLDTTKGLQICQDMLENIYDSHCNAGKFIITALLTVIAIICSSLLPIIMIYVRCCKKY